MDDGSPVADRNEIFMTGNSLASVSKPRRDEIAAYIPTKNKINATYVSYVSWIHKQLSAVTAYSVNKWLDAMADTDTDTKQIEMRCSNHRSYDNMCPLLSSTTYRHVFEEFNVGLSDSGCCNHIKCGHPLIDSQQKSIVVGQEECLRHPESLASRRRSNLTARPYKVLSFFLSMSWHKWYTIS